MISALLNRPLRLLLVLATVLCAVGVATGSGATFRSSTVNGSNAFVSGTLLQTNSRSGGAVLSASGMRPGGTATGEVVVKNSGTLPATFKLSETAATNTFTAGSMTVRVTDAASSAVVYDGDVGSLGARSLGDFAPGEARTYRFTATLSATAPPADQGKTAGATYVWDGVQTAATAG